MKQAIKILQLLASLAAVSAIVAADWVGVELSPYAIGALAFVAGLGTKRPSDMLPKPTG